MSVRVTRVKRSSLSRIGTIRSVTRNDNKNIHEKQVNNFIFNRIIKLISPLFLQKLSKDMRIRPIPFEPRTSSQSPICSSFLQMSQISSFHKNKSKYPRLSIPSYDIFHPTSMVNFISYFKLIFLFD
jgi:hypothetical protein